MNEQEGRWEKTVTFTIRAVDRLVSLHLNKFQTESTTETHSSYLVCFTNTAQPNLQANTLKHGVTHATTEAPISFKPFVIPRGAK